MSRCGLRVLYHALIILFVSLDLCSGVLVIQVIGNVVRVCCVLLWSIMTPHSHLAQDKPGWPTSSYQWRSQQFNQRSISALWNDNDCNSCELSLVNTFLPNKVWSMIGYLTQRWRKPGWQLLDRRVKEIPRHDEYISADHSPLTSSLASDCCNFWLLRSLLQKRFL